jgi:hypothetical protein
MDWKGINSRSKSFGFTFMVFFGTIWNVTFQRFCLFVLRWIQNKHHIARGRTILLILLQLTRLEAHTRLYFSSKIKAFQFINWDSEAVCTLPFWQSSYILWLHLLLRTLPRVKNTQYIDLKAPPGTALIYGNLNFCNSFYVSVIYETHVNQSSSSFA